MRWNPFFFAGCGFIAACSAASAGPPEEITGTWSGTIGDIALLNLTLSEDPVGGGVITGSAFVVSLTATNALKVTGSGSVEAGYELSLQLPLSAFELRIVGSLGGAGFSGTYDFPLGSGSDLGLEDDSGSVGFDAAPVDGIGGRFFRGDWDPVGTEVVIALGQNGTTLRGLVTWTDSDCLSQATLEGRLTGSHLEARLLPLDPALPEGSVDLTWGAADETLAGSWAFAWRKPVLPPCSTFPSEGSANLLEFGFGFPQATGEPRGPRPIYLRVEAGGSSTEILYRR